MKVLKGLIALLFISVIAPIAWGQEQKEVVQVVTKTISKDFNYKQGYEVNIEGEKADITVETWDKKQIAINLEITSRHVDLKIAESDLENINYLAERVKNKIYLRNYRADKNRDANSNLEIKYTIIVPEDCPVYVKNYFGMASISNLTNRLRVYGEYSQIDMNNIEGMLDIRTRFGDILGDKIGGNVTINARRSDVILHDITGNYTINAQYGTLELHPIAGLTAMNISAEKSEVFLYDNGLTPFSYQLTTTHGQLETPPDFRTIVLEETPELQRVQIKPQTELHGQITISVTFGDLTVEKEPKIRN